MKLSASLTLKLCLILAATVPGAAPATPPALSASPSAVNFQYTYPQQAPPPVNVNITASDGSSPALAVSLTPGTGTPPTLFVTTLVHSTVGVAVDVRTLNSLLTLPGVYQANISVTAAGFSPLTVPVALSVNAPLSITALPTSLTFNLPAGPTVQTIALTGANNAAVSFTLTGNTTSGGNWLSATTDRTYTPATVTVTVDQGSLQSGIYPGSITITPSSGSSFVVPVTLQLGVSSLSASPGSLSFAYSLGGTVPLPQVVQLSSSLANDTYTAQAASSGDWLLVNGVTDNLSGTLPASLNVTINAANLTAGTYGGTITATGSNGSTATVNVTLVVSGLSIVANPIALTFVAESGGAPPASQVVSINGSANATFTATVSAAWLSVSAASGPAPGQVTVTATPAGLAAGTYSTNLQIKVGSRVQTVKVTLIVSGDPVLTVNPGSIFFVFLGGNPQPSPYTFNVGVSSGDAQTFTVASGTPAWLQVATTAPTWTTPAALSVTLTPQNLSTGTYLASVILVPAAAGGVPVTVPVLLQVSGATPVVPNPASLTFSAAAGDGPQSQTVQITASTVTSFTAGASTASGGDWLSVSPTSAVTSLGNTPLTITADASSLLEGTYEGAITLTTLIGVVTQVQVTLNVGSGANPITVSPAALAFTYTQGGAPPAAQSVQVTGSQSFAASAAAGTGGAWLSVDPPTGTGDASLSVTANPAGLAPGSYSGSVTITPASGAAQTVTVTLTVTAAASLTATPNPLAFAFTSGNPPPADQTLSVTSGGAAIPFTAAASSNGWLAVTPTSGTTPATLTVSVNPGSLGAGSYQGSISLSGENGTPQFNVNVTLTVVAPLPVLSRVLNAASYLGGGISPGEIIVVFGDSLGPATGAFAQIDSSGHIPATLANVQVTFNGYPGPILYASAGQINAIVPYALTAGSNATVEVIFGSARSNTVSLPVVSSAPGIFSADASGTGGGAILDLDYRLVSPGNPVSPGSTIQIFATGQGQTSPAGVDGLIEPLTLPLPIPLLAAGVLIDNLPATIQYIGAAPGIVAGALQVNAVVPPGVRSGAVPLIVSIGGHSSQNGLTVAIQ